MLKNWRLAIINASLVLALIFSLVPQYWPAAEILSRYIVLLCSVAAVCSYLLGLDSSERHDSSIVKAESDHVDHEKRTQPTALSSNETLVAFGKPVTAWMPAHNRAMMDFWLKKDLLPFGDASLSARIHAFAKHADAQALNPQVVNELVRSLSGDIGATNEAVTFGVLAFQIKGNEATIHVVSSKKVLSKIPRSSYPLFAGGQEIRLGRRVLH